MNEPSNAEIARRLDETAGRLDAIARDLATSYVRKDVYESDQRALRAEMAAGVKDVRDDVDEIKKQRTDDANRWKQAMFGLGVSLLLLVVSGVIQVIQFMAQVAGRG